MVRFTSTIITNHCSPTKAHYYCLNSFRFNPLELFIMRSSIFIPLHLPFSHSPTPSLSPSPHHSIAHKPVNHVKPYSPAAICTLVISISPVSTDMLNQLFSSRNHLSCPLMLISKSLSVYLPILRSTIPPFLLSSFP